MSTTQPRPDHPLAALAALAWGAIGIPTLVITACWATGVTPTEHTTPAPIAHVQPTHVDEDDPAWRCWAHGNHTCTPLPLAGR